MFEYWRSAKLIAFLERSGAVIAGRVLDDGCGGGGMCVSFAEETASVVGIDLADRFRDAGTVLAREEDISGTHFAQADATTLPFRDEAFDLVLSHSVIEHVADPAPYLREARRVLRRGGMMFLQTAPYLSPSGSHLPRLRVPVPLYLLMGSMLLSSTIRATRPSCQVARRHGRGTRPPGRSCDGRDAAGARAPLSPMIPTWPDWSTVSRPRMGSSHRVREKPPARRPRVVVEEPAQSRPAPPAASGARWGRLAYQDPSLRPP